MKSWIRMSKGRVTRQAYTGLDELGLKEDEFGRQGFNGRVAELYRRHEPTGWTRSTGSLLFWDLDGYALASSDQSNPDGTPMRIFYNQDVVVSISRRSAPMPYLYRNVNCDEVYFVHLGTGTVETEFGPIPYEAGDWIVLPKAITYRIVPDTKDNYFLITETVGEVKICDFDLLGRHLPFDPSVLFVPEPKPRPLAKTNSDPSEWEIRIKHGDEYSSFFYPFDPMDVEGWKGDLFPFKINIRDYRVISCERLHMIPTAYRLFEATGVIFCNILPRRAETDPDASRVPTYHRNVDFDEVTFLHGGSVIGAKLAPATLALSPQGAHHGLPQAFRDYLKKNWKKDEYLDIQIMAIEVSKSLKIAEEAKSAARNVGKPARQQIFDQMQRELASAK